MGMGVERTALRIGQLGEAELADVARERGLGDDESLGGERLAQLVLALDAPLPDDPQDGGVTLDLHSGRLVAIHVPSSHKGGHHIPRAARQRQLLGRAVRRRRGGHRMTTQSPHLPGPQPAGLRRQARARARRSTVQSASARRRVEPRQRPRGARLRQQVERRRRSPRNRCPSPTRIRAASSAASGASPWPCARLDQRAVGDGRARAGQPPDVGSGGPHHVDAERPRRQHPVLVEPLRRACGPAALASGCRARATRRRTAPAPRGEQRALRRRLGQMHGERQPVARAQAAVAR